MDFGPLISTKWLSEHRSDADVKIIDGSWRMPGTGNAFEDYEQRHIPNAVFFDIDAISDPASDLPHMLPEKEAFADAVGNMGISETDTIVVYDDQGLFSAARVWWTFRAMGHDKIAVLDGGLPQWTNDGYPTTADPSATKTTTYVPAPNDNICASAGSVRQALTDETATVVDARAGPRFDGTAPEPRAGLRSGHMPGAKNVPFGALVSDAGKLHPPAALRRLFEEAGVNPGTRVISSCGSGVTAAVVYLALEVLGCTDQAVYDGAWAEWGDEKNDDRLFPVVTSEH